MACDGGLNQLGPRLAQAFKGARLILFHEAAVPDHVRCENGRKPPFHANLLNSAPKLILTQTGAVWCNAID